MSRGHRSINHQRLTMFYQHALLALFLSFLIGTKCAFYRGQWPEFEKCFLDGYVLVGGNQPLQLTGICMLTINYRPLVIPWHPQSIWLHNHDLEITFLGLLCCLGCLCPKSSGWLTVRALVYTGVSGHGAWYSTIILAFVPASIFHRGKPSGAKVYILWVNPMLRACLGPAKVKILEAVLIDETG